MGFRIFLYFYDKYHEERQLKIEFHGLTRTKIIENDGWEIHDSFTGETLGTLDGISKIPIGTNLWSFQMLLDYDYGSSWITEEKGLNFHKYVDQPGNFCCNDGTCFTSEFVCDGLFHCPSGDDELMCTMIHIPELYNKLEPPEEVFANISIVDIMAVDEEDSSFEVYFRLSVKWFDRSLEFRYLKNEDYANIIPEKYARLIWIPKLDFSFMRKNGKSISFLDKGPIQHYPGDIRSLSLDEHHQPGHQLHHRRQQA